MLSDTRSLPFALPGLLALLLEPLSDYHRYLLNVPARFWDTTCLWRTACYDCQRPADYGLGANAGRLQPD